MITQNMYTKRLKKPDQPGPVAWSDARPPGMQMVAGSILGSGYILSLRLIMK